MQKNVYSEIHRTPSSTAVNSKAKVPHTHTQKKSKERKKKTGRGREKKEGGWGRRRRGGSVGRKAKVWVPRDPGIRALPWCRLGAATVSEGCAQFGSRVGAYGVQGRAQTCAVRQPLERCQVRVSQTVATRGFGCVNRVANFSQVNHTKRLSRGLLCLLVLTASVKV